MEQLPHAFTATMSDLLSRCLDASFDRDFPLSGAFFSRTLRGRQYWYYSGYTKTGGKFQKYVGPDKDPEVQKRIEAFDRSKSDYRVRRGMVDALVAYGLPSPAPIAGEILSALESAGLFRLRGVVVGTVAYQAYGPLLGVKIPADAGAMTEDIDFAQDYGISIAVEDRTENILDVLRQIDPTFESVSSLDKAALPTRFRNRAHFTVEFLTTNRGSDDHQGHAARMPALGGASAEPLRFLDFLIRNPERTVILYRGGIPVLVPRPERYAIHKLIVAERRAQDGGNTEKSRKDIAQANTLFKALLVGHRNVELGEAWIEAWSRGPMWQSLLSRAITRLDDMDGSRTILRNAIKAAAQLAGDDGSRYGLDHFQSEAPEPQ